jgi:hypothetical protein
VVLSMPDVGACVSPSPGQGQQSASFTFLNSRLQQMSVSVIAGPRNHSATRYNGPDYDPFR